MPNINASNFQINSPRPGSSSSNELRLQSQGGGGRQIRKQRLCIFFEKGNCRNGGNCNFSHGDFDGFEPPELMSMKQTFALMPDDEFVHFLDEHQRSVFLQMGRLSDAEEHTSRQIYLTFRPDSTFNEEDVSAYFSTFGRVSNVRIPFQENRTFGFVTFVHLETVKHILERPDLHYVRACRVHVKRYKTMNQRMEEREKMMLRKKLEHEVALRTLELERHRMMNLQLMGEHHHHHNPPFQPPRPPIFYPRQPQFVMTQNVPSHATNQGILQDGQRATYSPAVALDSSIYNRIDSGNKQRHLDDDDSESLEHRLPDDPFGVGS